MHLLLSFLGGDPFKQNHHALQLLGTLIDINLCARFKPQGFEALETLEVSENGLWRSPVVN